MKFIIYRNDYSLTTITITTITTITISIIIPSTIIPTTNIIQFIFHVTDLIFIFLNYYSSVTFSKLEITSFASRTS